MWDKDALVDQPKSESRLEGQGEGRSGLEVPALPLPSWPAAPVKMLYEAMLIEAFWEADSQMVRDFYWGKCLKDRREGAGKGKWTYRRWCQSGPWRDQRERRMMWKTLRTQRYSKKAPTKLIKSLKQNSSSRESPSCRNGAATVPRLAELLTGISPGQAWPPCRCHLGSHWSHWSTLLLLVDDLRDTFLWLPGRQFAKSHVSTAW